MHGFSLREGGAIDSVIDEWFAVVWRDVERKAWRGSAAFLGL